MVHYGVSGHVLFLQSMGADIVTFTQKLVTGINSADTPHLIPKQTTSPGLFFLFQPCPIQLSNSLPYASALTCFSCATIYSTLNLPINVFSLMPPTRVLMINVL